MNKTKELLTVEFRYTRISTWDRDDDYCTKTFTIGIYDSLEEAVIMGNLTLLTLSETFEVRSTDRFKVKGLFDFPDRLVSNNCYPTKGVMYFAKIETLNFVEIDTFQNEINEIMDEKDKYIEYKKKEIYSNE
jgi:hypothetical protein